MTSAALCWCRRNRGRGGVVGSVAQIVGIAWFERADYPWLLALFADRKDQWSTYDEWLASAQNVEAKVTASGVQVIRVMLRPAEFSRWCKRNGLKTDGKALRASPPRARSG